MRASDALLALHAQRRATGEAPEPRRVVPLPIALTDADIARFWGKVDRSGGPDACWPWLACKSGNGYGCFVVGGKKLKAHRVALALSGRIVPERLACHRCDVKGCCNPDHLWPGTHAENTADAIAKGRVRTRRHQE